MKRPIYFDHNATTPLLPEVWESMQRAFAAGPTNSASSHATGRKARQQLEDAREMIGQILGADLSGAAADRVIFTSGGTEANNLALRGLSGSDPGHLVVSQIEHPSVVATANAMARKGWHVDRIGVRPEGVIPEVELDRHVRSDTRLLSVMMGNHETGVIQPIKEFATRGANLGIFTHTDAVQVVGKLPVDFAALGVDSLSCSAHKFHGPQGIGALVLKRAVELEPLMFGGPQQFGFRPGTEPVALAVGMATALRLWRIHRADWSAKLRKLRDQFESGLERIWPEVAIVGGEANRLPHTSNVSFPGLDRQELLMALDLAGIACSIGSACASGSTDPSPVLRAMGCSEPIVRGALRFSFGTGNTADEVEEALDRISRVFKDLHSQPPA